MKLRSAGGRLASFIAVSLLLPLTAAFAQPPILVPAPREVKWSGDAPVRLSPNAVAIVLGKLAAAPEEEGARLLREFVAKRFKQDWPIVREGEERPAHRVLIALGQRNTSGVVDTLCRTHGIALSEQSPGHDGYVIDFLAEGDRTRVLVGGSNARGVMYGQDTLAQMIRAEGSELVLVRGKVTDAPVIRWRGRPQTMVKHYLRPGELDLYATSRVNFIDLRSGIYAFEPGEKLDPVLIKEAVRQAHRRGFIVYATVNCGVPRHDYPKVMGTFRELLDLGADGLWLSFDDKGPGEDPVGLARDVLALGRERGMRDHLIALTPPKGSYPKITTEFNRKLMAVPGMEKAIWFWTAVPSREGLEEARAIGLSIQPGWWHNWPRLFTPRAYTGMPPLAIGWSAPTYELLAEGGKYLDAAMPWGGNGLGQHYVVPVINWWAWNPPGHDWNALRRRVTGMVFGEAQAADAMAFDDRLQELFALFRYSHKHGDNLPQCPPRLRANSGGSARMLMTEMSTLLERVARHAPAHTLLPVEELKTAYLEPMRRELETHQRAAELNFPEEWWPAEQRKILAAMYCGDTAAGERVIAEARKRTHREVDRIVAALPEFPRVKDYAAWWRARADLDMKGWKALHGAREKLLAERVLDYNRIVETGTMLAEMRTPPLEWGIGRWQVSNRLLATVLPSPEPHYWGDWQAGLHQQDGIMAAVFAAHRKVPGEPGEYAELPVAVPVAGRRDRLALLFAVSSTNKDLFSNTMVPFRWAGYRFMQLRWGEKVLWEQDIGAVRETGEWFMVRLPEIPGDVKEMKLELRVQDRRTSFNNYTVAYVSPLRLLELPE